MGGRAGGFCECGDSGDWMFALYPWRQAYKKPPVYPLCFTLNNIKLEVNKWEKKKNCTGAISKLLNNHTLRYFINEPEMDVHTKPYTWLLTEASFLMDKPCKKQSRHHATKGWVNRRWIRTVEHCPALQRGELLNHGKIWHNAKCRSRKELSTACSSSVALWGNKRLQRHCEG